MLAQHLCSKGYCFIRSQRSIGKHIHGQLIKISHLTDTRVLYRDIYPLYRGVNGIHCNDSDGKIIGFIPIRTHIASAVCNNELHIKLCISAGECCNHQIGIHDLQILIHLNIRGMYHTLSVKFNISRLRLVVHRIVANGKTLDVHHNFRHILFYTGDG